MKNIFSLSAVVLVSILGSGPARAWGDLGHQTVGEIAEENLSEKGKNFVFEVLGVEPLADAATFADHVRDDDRFKDFADYHYFDILDGQDPASIPASKRDKKDAAVLIADAPLELAASKMSREQKMILLRYLVHVVGDVHQPLHIGNGLDMGANLCNVKFKNTYGEMKETKLHSFIDDGIFDFIRKDIQKDGKSGWFGYKQLAAAIKKEVDGGKIAAIDVKKVDLDANVWYRESRALHSVVYPDAKSGIDPAKRAYCKIKSPSGEIVEGVYLSSAIPTLSEAYLDALIPVVEVQLYRGGMRLAALINKIADDAKVSDVFGTKDIDLLKSVQFTN